MRSNAKQREMKTPIQEHIEWLKEKHKTGVNPKLLPYVEIGDCIEHAESMLEKEEVMLKYSYWEGIEDDMQLKVSVNDWYNKTFNTKEK